MNEISTVAGSAVLVFDGLFLHRPELRLFWDYSVFLNADEPERRAGVVIDSNELEHPQIVSPAP